MIKIGDYVTATIVGRHTAVQGIVTALHGDVTMTVRWYDGSSYECSVEGASVVKYIYNNLEWIADMRKQLGVDQ